MKDGYKVAEALAEVARKNKFIATPNGKVSIAHIQAVVFMLQKHSDKNGNSYPSISTLCKETGLARATVARALRALKALGMLTISRKGKRNTYNLHPPTSSQCELISIGTSSQVIHTSSQCELERIAKSQGNLPKTDGNRRTRKSEHTQEHTHNNLLCGVGVEHRNTGDGISLSRVQCQEYLGYSKHPGKEYSGSKRGRIEGQKDIAWNIADDRESEMGKAGRIGGEWKRLGEIGIGVEAKGTGIKLPTIPGHPTAPISPKCVSQGTQDARGVQGMHNTQDTHSLQDTQGTRYIQLEDKGYKLKIAVTGDTGGANNRWWTECDVCGKAYCLNERMIPGVRIAVDKAKITLRVEVPDPPKPLCKECAIKIADKGLQLIRAAIGM